MNRQKIYDAVTAKKDVILNAADRIWENPELYFHETFAAKTLIGILKDEGFEVEEKVAGIPTAFIGSYGQGKPVIAILGEFDALPGLSQEAGCTERKEVNKDGPGHGCGHNGIGTGGLAAAIAVKEYMIENDIQGTIRFYGCPAEEAGWGKMFLAHDGCFDDVDAAVTWHPSTLNMVSGRSSLSNLCAYFSFSGKTAHAAGAPWLGRSALDACELMNVGVNYLREHISPEARVHYAYIDAGGEAPNIVQDHAKLKYFIRAPKTTTVIEIADRIKDIAKGAALMTQTKVDMEFPAGMCDYVPNDCISNVMSEELMAAGAPEFEKEDYEFAEKFFKLVSPAEIAISVGKAKDCYENYEELSNTALVDTAAPYKRSDICGFGSTDVGDVSYCTPTAQLNLASYANGTPAHSWMLTAQGKSGIMHKAIIKAGQVLAATAVSLMEQPEVLKKAKEEYVKATGGKYICPVGDNGKIDL